MRTIELGQRQRRRRGRRRPRIRPPGDKMNRPPHCSGTGFFARKTLQDDWKLFKKRQVDSLSCNSTQLQQLPLLPMLLVLSSVILFILNGNDVVSAKRLNGDQTSKPVGLTMRRHKHNFPSVSLPKYGLVRGLRFDWSLLSSEVDHQNNEQHHREPESVAAFLGVPYAAPPAGPLRFMPPGAARPTALRLSDNSQCLLSANSQSAQANGYTTSRPFVEFGHECVRLMDWLPALATPDAHRAQVASNQQRQAVRRQEQSEDCLNLNVFVPLEPNKRHSGYSEQRPTAKIKTSQSRLPNEAPRTSPVNKQHAEEASNQTSRLISRRHATVAANVGLNPTRRAQDQGHPIGFGPDGIEHDQQQPICYLQPIIQTSQDSVKLNGRDDNSSPRLHQSVSRRRLPVIVVFHSDYQTEVASEPLFNRNETYMQSSSDSSDIGQVIANATNRHKTTNREEYNKANSLVHLKLALRTKSIVITFNYRIGLLGYLPFVDLEDQQSGIGAGSSQAASHTRSNHALWDQIGLLHWIKHNVGYFGGDTTNVSLLSGDIKAAQMIQLLALSPQAKGLFKRLILLHEDADNNDAIHQSVTSNPDDYFARLFGLAQRARHLRKKLISELGIIIDREKLYDDTRRSSDDGQEENFEVDRRVYKFLKSAQLEQLAKVEYELAKVNVAQTQVLKSTNSKQERSSYPAATFTTRLIDVIQQPNLDDKLLFPYFSHLTKMNQSLDIWPDESQSKQAQSVGFWSWLAASLDEFQHSENSTMTLQRVQLEADYCRYMQQLYAQMFSSRPDPELDLNAPNFTGELKRLDPYKLIPRVNDHQLMMMTTSIATTSTTTSSTTIRKETGSSANGSGSGTKQSDKDAANQHQQQHQTVNQFNSKWRQRNRTANALEFYHLRHAHLLQRLLVQTIDQLKHGTGDNQSGLGGANRTRDLTLDEYGNVERNDKRDDDDDEDESDQLVTRLQRQQQRSIMIMQQQQSGHDSSGFSRNKRDSTDGQATVLAQQLLELLASFDLFIGVGGDLFENGFDEINTETTDGAYHQSGLLEAISQLALQDKIPSKSLVSYLQLADLHHLATIKSAPRYLNSLCEFSGRQSNLAASNWWQERKFDGLRTSFVVVDNRQHRRRLSTSNEIDLNMLDSKQHFLGDDNLLMRIGEFVNTGKLTRMFSIGNSKEDVKNGSSNDLARPFDTLNRQILWTEPIALHNASSNYNEQTLVRDTISFQLSLVPYLRRVLRVTNSRHQSNGLATKHDHERLLDHPLMPSVDLISCLSELDSILTTKTNQEHNHHHHHLHENSTLVRFNEESPCLVNATNKLRQQLRAGATEELEPLIRKYFEINEQRQKQQHYQTATTTTARGGDGVQQDSNKHMQATLANYQKQHGQRVSSMTTRNLVNQSEGLYLDQLSSSSASAAASTGGGVADQIGHHLERDLVFGLNSDEHKKLDTNQSGSGRTTSSQGGIRGFFAKTYKDAVGQALSIVIGTGLLIFLLNSIIVLVIAFRSRRNLRRAAGGHSRQAVQDSSLSAPSTTDNTIINTDQPIGQFAALNSSDKVECQNSIYGKVLPPQLNDLSDTRRLQVNGQVRQSTSSFKNHCQQEQQSTLTRASLSSNSTQRVNKSIKFDLSGASDKNTAGSNSSQNQSQRSIMKQPVTTSEDDELQMTDTVTGGNCSHHQHQHNSHELNTYMQAAISPASLDVLDLIPLDNLTGYDPNELVVSSGDEYLSAAQYMMTSKCHLNLNHHHRVHHRQQHQQQSFGGSSLTSPFASQSTHSTISTSNNGHMHNLINSGGPLDFSPRRDGRTQPHHTIYVTPFGAMNSPTSSNTLSSAPTPSQNQNQIGVVDQAYNEGDSTDLNNQVINLIYRGDSLIGRSGGVTLSGTHLDSGNLVMLSAQNQAMLEQQHKQWHQAQLES